MNSPVILLYSEVGESSDQIGEKLSAIDITLQEVGDIVRAQEGLKTAVYPVFLYRCDKVGENFLTLMRCINNHHLRTKVIVNARKGGVDDAVGVMKAGAVDFILSEGHDARITESVLRAVTQVTESPIHCSPQDAASSGENAPALIGKSPAITEIRSVVNLVAMSQTTVLVTGESGTGKEVVAHLIHLQSSRRDRHFYALNCASLPKDVIENELFGHEKGAFTGALLKKPGCFEVANGGTLFFDEIAEMSLETQAKLLRAIETQKFRRLGGKDEVGVDIRMIAATNKNISKALANKELREDLYYRLSVIEIYIPPLRERKEDVGLLIDHFLGLFSKKYGKSEQRFTDESLEMLNTYDWPGNVREVRNVIERTLVICPHEFIAPNYLPERILTQLSTQTNINIPLGSSTHEAERILILQTLASAGNNKAKTARILGVSRKTLHNKLLSFTRA
jgi:two-component system response regulator HydG